MCKTKRNFNIGVVEINFSPQGSYNSFKKIKKVIDNGSKVLYYYTTASEADKFLK